MMISRKAVSTVVVVGAMVMIQQTAIVTAFVSRLVFLVHMTKPFGGSDGDCVRDRVCSLCCGEC